MRNKLEIYGDILSALKSEAPNGEIKLTRVQLLSNMPYDRLVNYLKEFERLGLVKKDLMHLQEKGRMFVDDYEKIKQASEAVNTKYLSTDETSNMIIELNISDKDRRIVLFDSNNEQTTQYQIKGEEDSEHTIRELKQEKIILSHLLDSINNTDKKFSNLVKKKILIIDDNESITNMFSRFFTKNGFDCIQSNDGRNGLTLIKKEKFDVVILDLAMPEFTGVDVIEELKQNNLLEDLKIIVLTASALSDEHLDDLEKKGVHACMKKPVQLSELLQLINK